RQTPSKWEFGVHGSLVIARNPHRRIMPDPLPPEVLDLVEHSTSAGRLAAVSELARLAAGVNLNRAAGARDALTGLGDDDSRSVSAAATDALYGVTVRLSPSAIDLGRVPIDASPLVAEITVEGGPLALASTVSESAGGASASALHARLDA